MTSYGQENQYHFQLLHHSSWITSKKYISARISEAVRLLVSSLPDIQPNDGTCMHTHMHTHTCTHTCAHTHTGVLVQLLMKLSTPTEKKLCTEKIKINVKCTHFKQGVGDGVGLLRCQPYFSDHISLVDQIWYMHAEKKKRGKKEVMFSYVCFCPC